MKKLSSHLSTGLKLAMLGLIICLIGAALVYAGFRSLGLTGFWLGLGMGFVGGTIQLSKLLDKLSK